MGAWSAREEGEDDRLTGGSKMAAGERKNRGGARAAVGLLGCEAGQGLAGLGPVGLARLAFLTFFLFFSFSVLQTAIAV